MSILNAHRGECRSAVVPMTVPSPGAANSANSACVILRLAYASTTLRVGLATTSSRSIPSGTAAPRWAAAARGSTAADGSGSCASARSGGKEPGPEKTLHVLLRSAALLVERQAGSLGFQPLR